MTQHWQFIFETDVFTRGESKRLSINYFFDKFDSAEIHKRVSFFDCFFDEHADLFQGCSPEEVIFIFEYFDERATIILPDGETLVSF